MLGEGEGGGKKVRGGDVFRVESREKKEGEESSVPRNFKISNFNPVIPIFLFSYFRFVKSR